MKNIFLRIMVGLLIPGLIVDPAACACFSAAAALGSRVSEAPVFTEQAFMLRSIPFLASFARHGHASINRTEAAAAMFGRGYTPKEAWQVIRPIYESGNWVSVSLDHHRPAVPTYRLTPNYRKMKATWRLVEAYYKNSAKTDPTALDHLKRLEGKVFRFLDKTRRWSGAVRWRELIFEWKDANHFMGGFVDGEAAFLPFPLIARLIEIHDQASHDQHRRTKQLALEVLAQLLHHEAEHLVNGPGWENPAEVTALVKKLDRLFTAVDIQPFGEIYLYINQIFLRIQRPFSRSFLMAA